MLKVYNSLTKQKEKFKTINPNEVMMYVCGPTVYDDIHIGNARSMIAFDTIRRYLEYVGYSVQYVSNFTDVDDKIIKRAKDLNISTKELSTKYIKSVQDDMQTLNIKSATQNPKATNYIEQMKTMIQHLIDENHAYVAQNGDVYFRTKSFSDYGALSHQKITELEVGASQRLDEESKYKEDELDFVLWKHAKDGEISWDAKFGQGRPGWHIECSAMVESIFGSTIDIHGGGQDLTFPHHENERAQSECLSHKTFANYWLHNGYVTVGNNEKMSKSLGNFTTVKNLVDKVDADVIRFFMAIVHYRRPLQFDETGIREAKVNLDKIKEAYEYVDFRLATSIAITDEYSLNECARYLSDFEMMMNDDFNTANAVTVVYEFVKWINEYIRQSSISTDVLNCIKETLEKMLNIFGIDLALNQETDEEQWILDLIAKRNEARKNKNYELSDKIRDELKNKGILLEDTAQGTKYKRIDA